MDERSRVNQRDASSQRLLLGDPPDAPVLGRGSLERRQVLDLCCQSVPQVQFTVRDRIVQLAFAPNVRSSTGAPQPDRPG